MVSSIRMLTSYRRQNDITYILVQWHLVVAPETLRNATKYSVSKVSCLYLFVLMSIKYILFIKCDSIWLSTILWFSLI